MKNKIKNEIIIASREFLPVFIYTGVFSYTRLKLKGNVKM